jgi:hypothetical protein
MCQAAGQQVMTKTCDHANSRINLSDGPLRFGRHSLRSRLQGDRALVKQLSVSNL